MKKNWKNNWFESIKPISPTSAKCSVAATAISTLVLSAIFFQIAPAFGVELCRLETEAPQTGASEAGAPEAENAPAVPSNALRFAQDDESLNLFDGEKLIFSYRYAFFEHKQVPETDARRWAGDYIYPLNGLDGENLTDDAPKDHYHHHGLFWTWPHVAVWEPDGSARRYDLWTSNTPIRQRFVRFVEKSAPGGVDGAGNSDNNGGANASGSAVFAVENGWYVDGGSTTPDAELDPTKTGEKIAENERFYGEKILTELVRVETFPVEVVDGLRTRAVDVELTLIIGDKPVSLRGAEQKSYGGLSIRFRPTGKSGTVDTIVTDEGVAKGDMPEKPLRWADFTSQFGARDAETGEPTAPSGAAIFLSPNFPDFPPTWLTRYYGPLCVGWPGVVERKFAPGERIVMKARIWLHEGRPSLETLQKAFESWAESERNAASEAN